MATATATSSAPRAAAGAGDGAREAPGDERVLLRGRMLVGLGEVKRWFLLDRAGFRLFTRLVGLLRLLGFLASGPLLRLRLSRPCSALRRPARLRGSSIRVAVARR